VRQKRGSGAAAAKTCACAGAISAPRLRRTAISTRSNWTAIGPSGPLSVQFRTNRTKSPKRTTLVVPPCDVRPLGGWWDVPYN
jgi:hypothetical protein